MLVTIELCTLAFRLDRATKTDIVSAALFGDGAAAAIFRSGDGPAIGRVGGATEHLWENTIDIMGWSTDEAGLGVILSRSLPDFVAQNYRLEYDRAHGAASASRRRISTASFATPAERKCSKRSKRRSNSAGSLALERSVMRDFGNMSSPTVLFVFERTLAQGFTGTAVLAALGPGFTASFAALDVALV